jgi:hypothetical protein
MSLQGRKILLELVTARAKGIADREALVTEYLAARLDNFKRRMQTVNEQYRDNADLPPCPPDCPPKEINGVVI